MTVQASSRRFRMQRQAIAEKLLFFILALALPLALASSPTTFGDGDVSWHIAAGKWILQHHAVPTTDPFSFTAAGHPWVAMEWLADVLFAAGYNAAGYAGVATVVAAALIALHAILFLYLQRRTGPLALATTIIALDLVLYPFLLARPHVLVWPVIAGWTVLLLRSLDTGRAPPLWGALIMLVWTNVHGSFPLGALIGAAIAFDALTSAQWKTLPDWTVFGLASLLATLLNLNGAAGLLQPFRIAGMGTLTLIQEWEPSTPFFTPQFYVVVLLGLGAILWAGVKVPLGRLLLLLVMLALALMQVRHQSWFVIVAAAVIPPLFRAKPFSEQRVGLIAVAVVPLLAFRAALPLTLPDSSANPRQLIAAVPAKLRSQPVLNGYTFGGPLILAGIKPYIDGRSDMYGDAFVTDYSEIVNGDLGRFDRAVQRYGIRGTMLPAGNTRLIRALDSSPAWRRVYADQIGVIHVRRD